VMVNLC